jgi:hypothetical protein
MLEIVKNRFKLKKREKPLSLYYKSNRIFPVICTPIISRKINAMKKDAKTQHFVTVITLSLSPIFGFMTEQMSDKATSVQQDTINMMHNLINIFIYVPPFIFIIFIMEFLYF